MHGPRMKTLYFGADPKVLDLECSQSNGILHHLHMFMDLHEI